MSKVLIHLRDPIEVNHKAINIKTKIEIVAFPEKLTFGDLSKMTWGQNQYLNSMRLAEIINLNGLKLKDFERMSSQDGYAITELMIKLLNGVKR